jgi:hypothetical protein
MTTKSFFLLTMILAGSVARQVQAQGVYKMISSLDEIDSGATYIIYGYNQSAVSTKALRGVADGSYLLATDFAKAQVDEATWTITIPSSSAAADMPAELRLVPVDEADGVYGVRLKDEERFLYNLSGDELRLTEMAPEENRAIQWRMVESPRVNGVVVNNVRNEGSYIFNSSNKFRCSDKALNAGNNRGVLCKKVEDHVVIGSGGYASLVTRHDTDFSRTPHVRAYIVTAASAAGAVMAGVGSVAAGTPVIVRGTPGDHVLTWAASAPAAAGNLLQQGGTTGDGATVFALGSRNGAVGFFRVQEGVAVAEDKPYLVIPGAGSNTVFVPFIIDEGVATGLRAAAVSSPLPWYGPDGRRTAGAGRGIVVRGTRKVVVR